MCKVSITPKQAAEQLPGVSNQSLASGFRVLRITHDKGWFNDDDPGAAAPGWTRRCNPGHGDYNNDLTISETPGGTWRASFTGKTVDVIAPKEAGAGKMEVFIDGKKRATVNLSVTGGRKVQQVVFTARGLTAGKHEIKIINRGPDLYPLMP